MSDYYLVLGIDRDADLDKIKHAYRFYCKKYHPDLSSIEEKNKFLKIQEAYETLSDKEKRRAYDQSLERKTGQIPVNVVNDGYGNEKYSKNRNTKGFPSIFDEFFEGFGEALFKDDFFGDKELYLELILSREEAMDGGNFSIEVPAPEECSFCLGRGYINRFRCSFCNGTGTIYKEKSINLHVPPDITSGIRSRISLEGIGLPNIFINIEVVVNY